RMREGYLALLSPGPTIVTEQVQTCLAPFMPAPDAEGVRAISIAPGELAALTIRHHHAMWDAADWNGDCFGGNYACMRWNVGDNGWLIRCYHLRPVMMRVQRDNPTYFMRFEVSLDGDYVARLFDDTSRLCF